MPDHCPTALGPGPDGFGEYHDTALELARDTDVLIHDAQLFPEELLAFAGYGHAVADYAVELGRHAGARSVALFHHHPERTDDSSTASHGGSPARRSMRPRNRGHEARAVAPAGVGLEAGAGLEAGHRPWRAVPVLMLPDEATCKDRPVKRANVFSDECEYDDEDPDGYRAGAKHITRAPGARRWR